MNGWKTPLGFFTYDMKDGSRCARNQLGQTSNYSINKYLFSAYCVTITGLSTALINQVLVDQVLQCWPRCFVL